MPPSDVKNLLDTEYKYGFSQPEKFSFKTKKGLNENIVRQISKIKNEPGWMTDIRLKAYKHFVDRPMPKWGADLSKIDLRVIKVDKDGSVISIGGDLNG